MSIDVYHIIGLSGTHKSVSLWHTNKHLKNFHLSLEQDLKKVYDDWPDGKYTFVAGYQNGYCELGITHITVETKMEP